MILIHRISAFFQELDDYLSVTISRRLRAALLLSAAATIFWFWSGPIMQISHGPYYYSVRYNQASLDSEYEQCVSLGAEEYHKKIHSVMPSYQLMKVRAKKLTLTKKIQSKYDHGSLTYLTSWDSHFLMPLFCLPYFQLYGF